MTVIEARVHTGSARRAKLAFILTAVAVALLYAVIFAARWPHPIAALLIGAGVGVLVAAPVWAVVRAWPVLVRIWWWLPELLITAALGWVWTVLVAHTPTAVALLVVAVVAAVCGLVPPVRRFLVAVYHCFEVRHRLRVCFTAFIVTNRHGSVPLILWAKPTPVGERVWIYLRPGLSLGDLQTRLEKIAVTCWATSVTAERAGSNSAYVVIDVKRREALTATVPSPLPGMVTVPDTPEGITTLPAAPTSPAPASAGSAGLNLADIPTQPTAEAKPRKPAQPTPAKDTPGPVAGSSGEDLSDWV